MNPLFRAPDAFILKAFKALPAAINHALPQSRRQEADLVYACRDLSAMLTTKRQELTYWASPRFCSAYLRYFLPWNLVRLTALLPALNFGPVPEAPLILDLGSGPLTLPLALWMSRPDLRDKPLSILAQDSSARALDLGREIFFHLTSEMGQPAPWRIATLRGPLMTSLSQVRGQPWLITMANMLNELEERPKNSRIDLERLLPKLSRLLAKDGGLLAVEPGTRQGGRIISRLRGLALGETDNYENDNYENEPEKNENEPQLPFFAHSPCPHSMPCPLSGDAGAAWCHMNTPVNFAPDYLHRLSQSAGLDKDSVSLSFVHLRREKAQNPTGQLRIISDAFTLPGYLGRARYACGEQGLYLIADSAFAPAGSLCRAEAIMQNNKPATDAKSGAWLVALQGRAPQNAPPLKTENPAASLASSEKPKQAKKRMLKPKAPKVKPFWEK